MAEWSGPVLWAAASALNAGLAYLIFQSARASIFRALLIALFLSHTVTAAIGTFASIFGMATPTLMLLRGADLVSIWATLVVPIAYDAVTRRSIPRTAGVAFTCAASAYAAAGVLLTFVAPLSAADHRFYFEFLPCSLGLPVGIIVLLDAFRKRTSITGSTETAILLAAYLATAVAYAGAHAPMVAASGVQLLPTFALLVSVAAMACAALLRALVVPERRAGAVIILGYSVLSLFLVLLHMSPLVWFLMRPILIAAAVVKLRAFSRTRPLTGPVIFIAVTASLAGYFAIVDAIGAIVDPSTAIAGGLLVGVPVAATLLWPLLQQSLQGAGQVPRAREAYSAALEELAREGSASEAVLRRLRQRLRVDEREHELLAAELLVEGAAAATQPLLLERYRVIRKVGRGGQSRVFLARDETMQRDVVLKWRLYEGPDEREALLAEARLLARIDHSQVVRIFDIEEVGESIIYVLEHVEGTTLEERLHERPFSTAEALDVARRLLSALAAVHAAGVVHRDIKPANILWTEHSGPKLTDFGIAREITTRTTATSLGLTSDPAGSLRYMSPEQVRGEAVDARSDLYSLGTVLYEIACREHYLPAQLNDLDARLAIVADSQVIVPRPIAPELSLLLSRLLAKDRTERPSDAREAMSILSGSMRPFRVDN